MSACTGSDEAEDVNGIANGILTVKSPSVVLVFGEPFVLCADADGALLGR